MTSMNGMLNKAIEKTAEEMGITANEVKGLIGESDDYRTRLYAFLSYYKERCLYITESGVWKNNGKKYSHILPIAEQEKNILSPLRAEFWKYLEQEKQAGREIKLHSDFHHLNSSQAMSFNLFFPFIHEKHWKVLFESLGIKPEPVKRALFEFVACKERESFVAYDSNYRKEQTNFDFMIELESGKRLYFEMKLSENGFGRREIKDGDQDRYEKIYQPLLKGKVKKLSLELLMSHYQLLRNISYVSPKLNHELFIIHPKANKALEGTEDEVKCLITPEIADKVHVVCLEDLAYKLFERFHAMKFIPLQIYFGKFHGKYAHVNWVQNLPSNKKK